MVQAVYPQSGGKSTFYDYRVADMSALVAIALTLTAADVGKTFWVEDIETEMAFVSYPLGEASFKSTTPLLNTLTAGVDGGGPYLQFNWSNGTSYKANVPELFPTVDPMTRYANVVEFRHDGGASAEGGFGTGTAGGSYGYTPSGGEPGAAYGGVTTQTSATGGAAIRTGFTSFNASNGKLYYMHREAFVTALSDETNSYVAYSGFSDSSTGAEPNNGAYFEYNQSESDNWQCVTAAGGSRTKTTTSVPVKVLASGTDKLQVKLEDGVAKFWINDTLVHTESLTIPSGWSQAFGATMTIRKTAGTTARILAFDMLYARQELTTSRNISEPAFA